MDLFQPLDSCGYVYTALIQWHEFIKCVLNNSSRHWRPTETAVKMLCLLPFKEVKLPISGIRTLLKLLINDSKVLRTVMSSLFFFIFSFSFLVFLLVMYSKRLVFWEFIFQAGFIVSRKFLKTTWISVSQEKLSNFFYKVVCELGFCSVWIHSMAWWWNVFYYASNKLSFEPIEALISL